MCRVLGLSRSGFYAWLKREPSSRARGNARLRARIREVHAESRGTYGVPRVHAKLRQEGHRVSRGRVARLMAECGLSGVTRRRKVTTTRRGTERPAPDLVEREFKADGPNRLWVADITYVPTATGFLYVATVLDVWSRRIVGWAMETHLRTELVLEALRMATRQRQPATGLIHHSDQGSQYTSTAFTRRCDDAGIRPSMGSVGDAYDNAMAESFFATLECELIDRFRFKNPDEAKGAVFSYVEGWYNPHRLHSSLGFLSPMAVEQAHEDRRAAAK